MEKASQVEFPAQSCIENAVSSALPPVAKYQGSRATLRYRVGWFYFDFDYRHCSYKGIASGWVLSIRRVGTAANKLRV